MHRYAEVATNVLMKQKRVMDLLNKTRKPLSVAELHNELGFPVDRGELWDMLLNNDKVLYTESTRRFSYKAGLLYKLSSVIQFTHSLKAPGFNPS